MENSSLYRKVKDTDMFAVEARFHRSSQMKFATDYHNHVHVIQGTQNKS